jgi:hypothetical protein
MANLLTKNLKLISSLLRKLRAGRATGSIFFDAILI